MTADDGPCAVIWGVLCTQSAFDVKYAGRKTNLEDAPVNMD